MTRTCLLAVVVVLSLGARADAGFVVVVNTTDAAVRFTVGHAQADPRPYSVGPHEVKRVPVGRHPDLTFESDGKPLHFRLAPYSAYAFTRSKVGISFQGIELAAPLPRPGDVPEAPPKDPKPLVLAVRVMVDDAEPRARAVWEKALRARVAAASAILERECGVTLKVAEVGEWRSDPRARTVAALLKDFEAVVPPVGRTVALGFSSRPIAPPTAADRCGAAATGGPLHRHVLVSESARVSEAERVELLAHQLAHLLGAAHSPDPLSLARPTMGDGKARLAKFRIGLDPLNALAVGLWVEEMRSGELKEWGDLRPPTRQRLAAVYKTIAHALPDDPIAKDYVARLDRLAPAAQKVEARAPTLTAKQQAVRKVVRAVAIRAADLSEKPEAERPKGDDLTAELVRTAAAVAATQEEEVQPTALLVGLGLALDHSTTLRDNLLTRTFCRPVESDAERRERVAALGSPTMRGRRDLCQHFVVSAALAELLEPAAAEAAGLLKERLDMAGASGFSFTDVAADFAGVEFARELHRDRRAVARASVVFEVKSFVPDVAGLAEGLSREKFETDYGSESDPRFRKVLDDVRKRIAVLRGYIR
ncbi:MAG TPA: hypothetical protein VFG68_11125 [Fimbriiglobus sp.]|nr:hypothetical protein [Fimbriiglobus sp.]